MARSILSDAYAARPSPLFSQAHRGLRRKIAETTYLVHSTSRRLFGLRARPASTPPCAAKLCMIYDPDADRPTYADVTPAEINAVTVGHDMPIEARAT